jgi:Na+-driven multidrug efflux pump
MCPSPFNDMVDMMAIVGWLAFFIGMIKAYGHTDFVLFVGVLILWTSLIILCYIFAPRHSVCTGIPYFYQSRYQKWKTGRYDWDTRIFREEDKHV